MKRLVAGGLVLALLPGLVHPPPAAAKRPRTPVVLFVFDETPLVSLLGRNGRIDARRYPNFARLARGSTWYANASTVSDATHLAIPSILDGRSPRKGTPATTSGHPRNIFTLLHAQGYRLEVQEEATSLCPYQGCKRRHGARYFLGSDRIGRIQRYIRNIGGPSGRPTLYYKHALLPHVPWIFTPSLRRYNRTVLGPIPGLNSSERSVFDPTLVHQSWQRHLLQVEAVDTLVGQLITQLKKTGLYDKAMVVVMADHGVSFRVGATDRRTIVPRNAGDIAPIPLFIKAPGQRRGRIDRRLLRTYDVLPTIAARIGLRLPGGVNGRRASSARVKHRRRISVISRASIGRVTYSKSGLIRIRSRALRRKLSLFGDGRGSLFYFGPNRRLISNYVSRLQVIGRDKLRGRLNDADAYQTVNPQSRFVPAQITGRITGGRPGARRNLAVAVNGRVWGVVRSVHLRGIPGEFFSFIVSEFLYAPGSNNIEVFTVGHTKKGYLLRRIYGKPYTGP